MSTPFACGNWSVDDVQVLRGPGGNRKLGPALTVMLRIMALHVNTVTPTAELQSAAENDGSLKVGICRIRKVLAQVGADCRIAKSYGRGYMLASDSEYAVRPSFSVAQWEAIQTAVAIADRYQPGIAARARLPI